ncbi:hypothetical protein AVEN_168801-1 [Araneus ventricosus]|uniref:Uncharacterized protein n=1 Tax=Araneus ventricosus TaxID=182803 RepID=A0A4Y2K9P4_ARAVE|nr:hypothetical protein AVEN_168801-1 [Araneus ventricosus]
MSSFILLSEATVVACVVVVIIYSCMNLIVRCTIVAGHLRRSACPCLMVVCTTATGRSVPRTILFQIAVCLTVASFYMEELPHLVYCPVDRELSNSFESMECCTGFLHHPACSFRGPA